MGSELIYEVRHVPKLVIKGGAASVTHVDRRWVHYAYDDNRRGKMLISEWMKLQKRRYKS